MGHSIDHLTPAPPAAFADLDGSNGFAVHGLDERDWLGFGIGGAGDVNGDGLDDLLVGAPNGDPNGLANAGESYVIFGKTEAFASVFDQTTLNGSNGFRIDGIEAATASGVSVANAGDIDGDGLADTIIGAPLTSPEGRLEAGSSYVILGSGQGWPPNFDLTTLDGYNGFRVDGAVSSDWSGLAVGSVGDFNGDGFNDMIVEATTTNFSGPINYYVVFGTGQGFFPSFDLASVDGSNGFRISGPEVNFDFDASSPGDVNGDGFDDILIKDSSVTSCGDMFSPCTTHQSNAVIFGTDQSLPASLDLNTLDGTNGFKITVVADGFFGDSIGGVGDFNGDGLADLAIGHFATSAYNNLDTGHVYIVFGTTQGFPAKLDVASLDGSNGFRIDGPANGRLGDAVGSAGDINGDGQDDMIIAQDAFAPDNYIYVVYGDDRPFPSTVDITALDSSQTVRIAVDPVLDGDFQTRTSSVGDINGDGFADFVTGSISGNPDGLPGAGKASAVFGNDFTASVTHAGGAGSNALVGTSAGDAMVGGLGNDILIGRGGADVLKGGAGHDALVVSDAGFRRLDGGGGKDALVVHGFDLDLTVIPDLRIRNVEVIALADGAPNQVTLALRDLRTMSETSNTITITGDNGDKVVIDLTGTGFQPTDLGNGFIEYTAQNVDNGLSLMVQDNLDLSGIIF